MYRNRRTIKRATPPTIGDTISARQERRYPVVDPSIFAGPAGWVVIHSAAATYDPKTMRQGFINLIDGFVNTFPCPRCRDNLRKHLRELPLQNYLDNRDELFMWTYLMHDKVNKLKHEKSPPLQEVKKLYFESLNIDCKDCGN